MLNVLRNMTIAFVGLGCAAELSAQTSSYPLAPTMSSDATILDWQRDWSDPSTSIGDFSIGIFQPKWSGEASLGKPRSPAKPNNPTLSTLGHPRATPPKLSHAKLGTPQADTKRTFRLSRAALQGDEAKLVAQRDEPTNEIETADERSAPPVRS